MNRAIGLNTWTSFFVGCLWMVLTPPMALSAPPVVQDEAGFFSADAIAKANIAIKEFYDRTRSNRQIVIETYANIPAEKRSDYQPNNKEPFFRKWVAERMKAREVNGVMILICKNPSFIELGVSEDLSGRFFTKNNRENLTADLIKLFKEKKYDEGLLLITQAIPNSIRQNSGAGIRAGAVRIEPPKDLSDKIARGELKKPEPEESHWGWVLFLIVVLLIGMWILVALFRAAFRPNPTAVPPMSSQPPGNMGAGYGTGYASPMPLYGSGGGGFFTNFLGGLFGAAAGHYLYDSFFRSHPRSGMTGYDASPTSGLDNNPGGAGPAYGDNFSLGNDDRFSGGDFGATSGGDFGGSDFGGGGGDFGGGDFGGGEF